MKSKYLTLLIIVVVAIFGACTPDEPEVVVIPPIDRDIQEVTDRDSLVGYLQTHYYNKSFFSDPTADYSKDDIIIIDSPTDDEGNVYELLYDNITMHEASFLSQDYEYYVLNLNPGESLSSIAMILE